MSFTKRFIYFQQRRILIIHTKFKEIPIGSINAKNKEIFGSKLTLPWQPNDKWSATILKQHVKRLLLFQ